MSDEEKIMRSGCIIKTPEALHEFGENTTLHGIRYVTEPNVHYFERFFWIVAIVTSTFLCGNELSKIYTKWQESPVITAPAQKPTPITSLPFPAVTICPENKVLRSVIDVEKNLDWIINQINDTNDNNNATERLLAEAISMVCEGEKMLKIMQSSFVVRPTVAHRNMIAKISPTLDDIFSHCIFQTTIFQCSELFRPVLTEDGQCFTFNMLQTKEIFKENYDGLELEEKNVNLIINISSWSLENGYKSRVKNEENRLDHADSRSEYPWREHLYLGPLSGLHVVLKLRKGETQDICSTNQNAENFKVTLHSPVEYPLPLRKYFHVPPNSKAMISVRPVSIETDAALRPPKYNASIRGCTFSEERPGFIFRNLTEHNCIFDTITETAVRECNCTLINMPMRGADNKPLEYCRKGHYRNCHKFLTTLDQCLPHCHELRYRFHVSYSNFYGLDQMCSTERLFHTTKIIVFFEEATYFALKKSELYGKTDFIANCGGLLGLFTGFSVISAIEIFYHASIRIFCRLQKRRRRRDHVHGDNNA